MSVSVLPPNRMPEPYFPPAEAVVSPQAVDIRPTGTPGFITLPSGNRVPLEWFMQAFFAELIRTGEIDLKTIQGFLEQERDWEKEIAGKRKVETELVREEGQKLKTVGKVREYSLAATLGLSAVSAIVSGSWLWGGLGLIGALFKAADEYFDHRGSDAVASWMSSFLDGKVPEERCKDAITIFSTGASIALSLGLSGSAAFSAASGLTQATLEYVKGGIEERHDGHKANLVEINYDSERVREIIERMMEEIQRNFEDIQQKLSAKIKLAKQHDSLFSSMCDMITGRRRR